MGRAGVAVQVIAALDTALWDLKARRANLPLAKLFGAQRDAVSCYNTSGGYLQASIEDVIDKAEQSRARGITPFLKVAGLAQNRGMILAPHFVMEIHLHLAAAYEHATWVEHFEWLEPLFNERLDIRDGKMLVPDRPGLGLTLHEQIAGWTLAQTEIGKRP